LIYKAMGFTRPRVCWAFRPGVERGALLVDISERPADQAFVPGMEPLRQAVLDHQIRRPTLLPARVRQQPRVAGTEREMMVRSQPGLRACCVPLWEVPDQDKSSP
jgi:hypothetical protein